MYQSLCTEFYDNDKPLADQREITFYQQYFTQDQLLLEPMCGSGRLLIPLLKAGFNVHGLDNSSYMLANCEKRLAQSSLKTQLFNQSVSDMQLTSRYDGILVPFGSFQLLFPRQVAYRVLEQFNHLLTANGKLMLDMYVPWEMMYEGEEHVKHEKCTQLPDGSKIILKSKINVNKYEQYYLSQDIYEKVKDDKIIATEKETLHLVWYFEYEFELLLEKYGFHDIQKVHKIIGQERLVTYIATKDK